MDIKIKDDKVNWICLGDKCPKNCCSEFKNHSHLTSLFNIPESLIPLTEDDMKRCKQLSRFAVKKDDCCFYIQTDENGRCPFLKDNKCTIHDKRPLSCRAYPFFLNKYNGLCIDKNCPGIGKGWTDISEIKKMISSLFKLHEFQIRCLKDKLDINS